MGANERKLVIDVAAWLLNVSTSVVIIMLTKILMTVYHFKFASTVSGLHFLSCGVSLKISEALGITEPGSVPLRDAVVFSLVASISIGAANISLLLNSIGFYQIAKLTIVPFVCFVEVVWFKRVFSAPVIASMVLVVVGVGIVTVTDVSVHMLGAVIAFIFVVTSGLQQILCGYLQSQHQVSSHQLLAITGPIEGGMLILCGPFVDKWITQKWVYEWEYNVPGINMLLITCAIAVAVNFSQFLCLGRFSATSYQVLGHTKTLLVLLGGWLLFHEEIGWKELSGMMLAVSGMIAYGYYMNKQAEPSKIIEIPPKEVLTKAELTHKEEIKA